MSQEELNAEIASMEQEAEKRKETGILSSDVGNYLSGDTQDDLIETDRRLQAANFDLDDMNRRGDRDSEDYRKLEYERDELVKIHNRLEDQLSID